MEIDPETHGHFARTRSVRPAHSAACVPFRWMLGEIVEVGTKNGEVGIAARLDPGWVPEREPEVRPRAGPWIETMANLVQDLLGASLTYRDEAFALDAIPAARLSSGRIRPMKPPSTNRDLNR